MYAFEEGSRVLLFIRDLQDLLPSPSGQHHIVTVRGWVRVDPNVMRFCLHVLNQMEHYRAGKTTSSLVYRPQFWNRGLKFQENRCLCINYARDAQHVAEEYYWLEGHADVYWPTFSGNSCDHQLRDRVFCVRNDKKLR